MVALAWILIILGAVIAFLGGALVKKKEFQSEEKRTKCLYTVKLIGMWIIIIGAFLIFAENGSFGIK